MSNPFAPAENRFQDAPASEHRHNYHHSSLPSDAAGKFADLIPPTATGGGNMLPIYIGAGVLIAFVLVVICVVIYKSIGTSDEDGETGGGNGTSIIPEHRPVMLESLRAGGDYALDPE